MIFFFKDIFFNLGRYFNEKILWFSGKKKGILLKSCLVNLLKKNVLIWKKLETKQTNWFVGNQLKIQGRVLNP